MGSIHAPSTSGPSGECSTLPPQPLPRPCSHEIAGGIEWRVGCDYGRHEIAYSDKPKESRNVLHRNHASYLPRRRGRVPNYCGWNADNMLYCRHSWGVAEVRCSLLPGRFHHSDLSGPSICKHSNAANRKLYERVVTGGVARDIQPRDYRVALLHRLGRWAQASRERRLNQSVQQQQEDSRSIQFPVSVFHSINRSSIYNSQKQGVRIVQPSSAAIHRSDSVDLDGHADADALVPSSSPSSFSSPASCGTCSPAGTSPYPSPPSLSLSGGAVCLGVTTILSLCVLTAVRKPSRMNS